MSTRLPQRCAIVPVSLLRTLLLIVLAAAGSVPSGCSQSARRDAPPLLESASPGAAVLIQTRSKSLESPEGIRATIGDQPAHVLSVVGERYVRVLVPSLDRGTYEASVTRNGKEIARQDLVVRDAVSRSYRFRLEGDKIALEATTPSNDRPTRSTPALLERLSFDLVTPDGQLIFTTAVLHPREVSGEGITTAASGRTELSRVRPAQVPSARVILPRVPNAASVRVYDVPRGLDISTDTGRAERKLIREFTLTQEAK